MVIALKPLDVALAWTVQVPTALLSSGRSNIPMVPPGLPFLVSRTSNDAVEAVISFMCVRYVVPAAGGFSARLRYSHHTREACVRDLKDFYDYLDSVQLEAFDLTPKYLDAYVATMLAQSPSTGKDYSLNTVKRRMHHVRAYVHWLQQEGRLRNRFPTDVVEGRLHKVEVVRAGRVHGFGPDDSLVRVMDFSEAKQILAALGPLPSEENKRPPRRSVRFRLAAEVALNTGLRRAEVAHLALSEIADGIRTAAQGDYQLVPVRVFGKGGKWRKVLFPIWLLKEIEVYISSERRDAVRPDEAREHHDETLFLNDEASRFRGRSTSALMIGREFRRVQKILQREGKLSHIFRFHDLRHTYAVWTWTHRRHCGDQDPSKAIQCQLGHSSRETTESVYLKPVLIFEATFYDSIYSSLK